MKISNLIVIYILSSLFIYIFSDIGQLKYIPILFIGLLLSIYFIKDYSTININNLQIYFIFLSFFIISYSFNYQKYNSIFYIIAFFINIIVAEFIFKYKLTKNQSLFLIVITLVLSIYPKYDDFTHGLLSLFHNANTLAIVLIMPMVLLFFIKDRISKKLFYVLFFGIIYLMLATHSRSEYLFIIVLIFMWIFSKFTNLLTFKIFMIMNILLALFIYYNLMMGDINNIIYNVLEYTQKGDNLTGRNRLVQIVFHELMYNPFGIGFGNSNIYIQSQIGNTLSPHNTYLKILLEGGYIAFIGFIIMILLMIKNLKNIYMLILLNAFLIKLIFESMLPFTFSLISLILTLIYFLGIDNKRCYKNE